MFTGLVEGTGRLQERVPCSPALRLGIDVHEAFGPAAACGERPGASVAINGCCLTLVSQEGGLWWFEAGPETLAKTNLGSIPCGGRVNLERALPADGRLGGHFVQGHIDAVGQVVSVRSEGEWTTVWFGVPRELTVQIVPKGSIAVDGVSLTVVETRESAFSVALIPHTQRVTRLGELREGDAVNVETDILAKYVQNYLLRQAGVK